MTFNQQLLKLLQSVGLPRECKYVNITMEIGKETVIDCVFYPRDKAGELIVKDTYLVTNKQKYILKEI